MIRDAPWMEEDRKRFAYCRRLQLVSYCTISIRLDSVLDLDGSAYCLTTCCLPFQPLTVGGWGWGATCTQCRLLNNPLGLIVVANDNRGIKLSDQVLNTTRTQKSPLTHVQLGTVRFHCAMEKSSLCTPYLIVKESFSNKATVSFYHYRRKQN